MFKHPLLLFSCEAPFCRNNSVVISVAKDFVLIRFYCRNLMVRKFSSLVFSFLTFYNSTCLKNNLHGSHSLCQVKKSIMLKSMKSKSQFSYLLFVLLWLLWCVCVMMHFHPLKHFTFTCFFFFSLMLLYNIRPLVALWLLLQTTQTLLLFSSYS